MSEKKNLGTDSTLYTNKTIHYSVKIISTESRTSEQSSDTSLLCSLHFHYGNKSRRKTQYSKSWRRQWKTTIV